MEVTVGRDLRGAGSSRMATHTAGLMQHSEELGSAHRRRMIGFTLAEILIALALIAILAAVLLPAVAGQIMKGDTGRTMQDLNAMRAGVDQFVADVRRYPMRYSQLTTKLATGARDVHGNLIPAGMLSKWAGPYVTKPLNNDGVLPTGFGAFIQDSLTKVVNASTGVTFVTVRVFGIDSAGFHRLDEEVDGSSATFPLRRTTGLIRWATGGVIDTTTFLATPIQ